ncbi:MAG: YIP1 family protein [Oscillospiraceae bacterium]|nr:YIP1 family protein [Oscillospiraceae bacterium]
MVYDLKLPAWKWPFYLVRHPFEGFEDLRWKKGYNTKVSMVIVLAFFVLTVIQAQMTGFLFNNSITKIFNIVPYFSSTILLFFTWVIANWSLCTLFNGEGTMRNICSTSAYALIPYLVSMIITTAASNVLLRREAGFLTFISLLGIAWSVIMMISGMKAVHQYSVPKTLVSLVFTLVAMVIILFILVLLVALFQQVYIFFYTIYTELVYRFS